jgi:hypothetical protein
MMPIEGMVMVPRLGNHEPKTGYPCRLPWILFLHGFNVWELSDG